MKLAKMCAFFKVVSKVLVILPRLSGKLVFMGCKPINSKLEDIFSKLDLIFTAPFPSKNDQKIQVKI